VKAGEVVAMYHPPTDGRPGVDVFNNELPAEDGRAVKLDIGDNVKESPMGDEGVMYEATADGLVDVTGSRISVSDVLQVHGDVDMETGNIAVKTGSVHVHGIVQTGFAVSVPDHLIVDGVIESCMVECGGDLQVGGGITMEGRNLVQVGGSLVMGYAQDAVINVAGDVTVNVGVTNSLITSGGKIVATNGKGAVHGGSVVAATGIEVFVAGSEMGVQTALTITQNVPELDKLKAEIQDVKSKLKRLEKGIGSGTARAILVQTPRPDRHIVAELLRVRGRLKERSRELHQEMRQISALNEKALEQSAIIVRKAVYPGVRITIGDHSMTVGQMLEGARFVWNAQDQIIEAKSVH